MRCLLASPAMTRPVLTTAGILGALAVMCFLGLSWQTQVVELNQRLQALESKMQGVAPTGAGATESKASAGPEAAKPSSPAATPSAAVAVEDQSVLAAWKEAKSAAETVTRRSLGVDVAWMGHKAYPDMVYLQEQWLECAHLPHVALVVNMPERTKRWEHTKELLLERGICPARFVACTPANSKVEASAEACAKANAGVPCVPTSTGNTNKAAIWYCRGRAIAATRDTMLSKMRKDVWCAIGHMMLWDWLQLGMRDDQWALIFEDDIMIQGPYDKVTGQEFSKMVTAAMEASDEKGHHFAWFGQNYFHCALNHNLHGKIEMESAPPLKFAPCIGSGSHAYMMTGYGMRMLVKRSKYYLDLMRDPDPPPDDGLCPHVNCIVDPWGAHDILREGCKTFPYGFLDDKTGRPTDNLTQAQEALRLKYDWPRSPPDYLKHGLAASTDVCGHLYGHGLQWKFRADYGGICYQNVDEFGSDLFTQCTGSAACQARKKKER